MASGELDAGALAGLRWEHAQGPLHVQVEDGLRRLIQSGQVAPGSALPGELDLAGRLGLSRHTIRHALGTLVAEGLLRRERGRGTHVRDPTARVNVRSLDQFYAFAWEVTARGLEQRSHVLERKRVVPPADLARRLMLTLGQAVVRIVRVRTAGGEPLIMEAAYLPEGLAEGLEAEILERGSIYDEIERRHGLRVTRAQETIRPTLLSRTLANLLGSHRGAPAFLVERTTWAGSRPIEWQQSTVRGDRFLYSVALGRAGNPPHAEACRAATVPGSVERASSHRSSSRSAVRFAPSGK